MKILSIKKSRDFQNIKNRGKKFVCPTLILTRIEVSQAYNFDTKNIDTQKKKAIIAQKTITNNKTAPSKSTKIDAPNTILNASISANKIPPSVEKKNIQATVNSIIETDTDEVVVENEATPTSTTTQNSIRNQPI